jgi:glutamate racemase
MTFTADAAVGVFDSGIGGLSVLRHIEARLPHQPLLYFADTGFAPYGEKPQSEIVARSLAIADFLLARGAKALVVACNTATVAAVGVLRARYPSLPVVGVEPGLKPAATLSKKRIVGVMATERTLAGEKFLTLLDKVADSSKVRFLLQGCTGLASQIEAGQLDSSATRELVQRYLDPLLAQGADTIVLGCTHYPFVLPLIREVIAAAKVGPVTIVDTGDAIARQLARLLIARGLLAPETQAGSVTCFTSGSTTALEAAFSSLLGQTVVATAAEPAI